MKKYLLLLFFAFSALVSSAQTSSYQKFLLADRQSECGQLSTYGSFTYLSVTSFDSVNQYYYILKFDESGNKVWSKEISNLGSVTNVLATSDGGCLVAGTYPDLTGVSGDSFYVAKINSAGSVNWFKTIMYREPGNIIAPRNNFAGFTETASGNYLVAVTYSDYLPNAGGPRFGFPYVMKINPAGTILWNNKYILLGNQANGFSAGSIANGIGGGFVMCEGNTQTAYAWAADSNGHVLWGQSYGGITFAANLPVAIFPNSSKTNYIMVCTNASFLQGALNLVTLNSNGAVDTASLFSFSGVSTFSLSQSVNSILPSGGGLISGTSDTGFFLAKFSADYSSVSWAKEYIAPYRTNAIQGASQSADGGYFASGSRDTSSNYYYTKLTSYLVKTDAQGNAPVCGQKDFTFNKSGIYITSTTTLFTDTSILGKPVVISANPTATDVYNETAAECSVTGIKDIAALTDVSLYPNPSEGYFNLDISSMQGGSATISIGNMLGEEVSRESIMLTAGNNHVNLNETKLLPGIYFVQLIQGKAAIVRKVVIE